MAKTDTQFKLTRWSLADLYPAANSAEMAAALDELEKLVADFEIKTIVAARRYPGR